MPHTLTMLTPPSPCYIPLIVLRPLTRRGRRHRRRPCLQRHRRPAQDGLRWRQEEEEGLGARRAAAAAAPASQALALTVTPPYASRLLAWAGGFFRGGPCQKSGRLYSFFDGPCVRLPTPCL